MFEIVSGQRLDSFFEQWLFRTGAPDIAIDSVKSTASESGYELSLTLRQSKPVYRLQVPVVVETQQGAAVHRLDLQQAQQTFTLHITEKPLAVQLDPDLRLFRQLAPGEAPPILREVMVNPTAVTLILSDKAEVKTAAEMLAGKLQQRSPVLIAQDQQLSAAPALIIGLQPEIDAWLAAQQLPAKPDVIDAKGSAQAWTVTRPDGGSLALISAKDAAALEDLIRPLPHYGRQSYIAFNGRQAIDKGTWPMQVQRVVVE